MNINRHSTVKDQELISVPVITGRYGPEPKIQQKLDTQRTSGMFQSSTFHVLLCPKSIRSK